MEKPIDYLKDKREAREAREEKLKKETTHGRLQKLISSKSTSALEKMKKIQTEASNLASKAMIREKD